MGMSFAEMHPELASEFSERNLPLTVSDITYGSNKKYWWIGKCEHEWLASPKSRHSGEGCPYCAGMRVLEGFNDLASIKPELVDEWSSENKPLKPNNVNEDARRFIPDSVPYNKTGEYIMKALEYYHRVQERQKDRGEAKLLTIAIVPVSMTSCFLLRMNPTPTFSIITLRLHLSDWNTVPCSLYYLCIYVAT